jgi:Skp family chaperone for outer membrane proteins
VKNSANSVDSPTEKKLRTELPACNEARPLHLPVRKRSRLGVALVCLTLAAAGGAWAQTATTGRVGIIQLQGALAGTKDGKAALADLQKRLEPRRADLTKRQTELTTLQDQLQRGSALAQTAKDDLTRNIDEKSKSFKRDVEDFQADVQTEQQKLGNSLLQKMLPVIDKYAQANGFSVILDVSNQDTPVLWRAESADITQAIIDLYDKTAAAGTAAAPAAPPAKK